MPQAPLPLTAVADGVRVAVRLTPKASRTAVTGLAPEADGRTVLTVKVTAAPEAGKANAALIALLAKHWRLPKGAITVAVGATDRRKALHVAGDPAELQRRLADWLTRQAENA